MSAAIDAVLNGDISFPTMVAERSEADAALAARLAQLTPQQFRVLLCLADGLLNKQIAHELGLAENTVKVHDGHSQSSNAIHAPRPRCWSV
ncbi:response regulator transcription factor [Staphylococcus epidermidis]|nr:response regulator transcription factor [Staphylococcus epidermidis]